jgi:hypothetical protein
MVCTKTQNKLCGDCDICYNRSFASNIDKAQYWSETNKLEPIEVCKYSNKKYKFNCNICGHEFENILSNISNGIWCSYCSNKKLCDDDCKQCYEKSFASSDKVQYWSETNKLKPRQVFKSTDNKYIFYCGCGHKFDSKLSSITNSNNWCSYCANKKLCEFDCKQCYEKSFASSDKAQYWSETNKLEPIQVFKSTHVKYIFDCGCGHEFESTLGNITKDQWCPYCANKKLCEFDCKQCFNKSFASSNKAQYWSYKNDKKPRPRQVFKSSAKKFIFNCNKCGHEFKSKLNNITNMNSWCPKCKNKTEGKIFDYLKLKYDNIKFQPKFDWCKNINTNRRLPYDILITLTSVNKELQPIQILIEVDGKQHFELIPHFHRNGEEDFTKGRITDNFKMKQALENNMFIIRICQRYAYNDNNNWQESLDEAIKLINSENLIKYIESDATNNYDNFFDTTIILSN